MAKQIHRGRGRLMRIRHLCFLGAAALAAAGCDDTSITDQSFGAVVTLVDSGAALKTARTFVLPDTVIRLSVSGTSVSPTVADALIREIRGQFLLLGWTELPDTSTSHPDVLILVAASTRIETGVAYGSWFSDWGYLPYWGAPVDASWAWGVPGGAVPYSFQAGTLLVTMLEVSAPRDETKRIPLLWAAALDGVIGDDSTIPRVIDGIDQAFEQSPYLRLN
jgi:hypothetical protein